jgi:putative membrane protein
MIAGMLTIIHLAVLTATVLLGSRYLPGVHVRNTGTAVLVAVVFSLLNFFVGWAIKLALVVPGILTLGLVFLFLPFIVNLVLVWLTDKVLHAFRVDSIKSYLLLAFGITMVNWLFSVVASRV